MDWVQGKRQKKIIDVEGPGNVTCDTKLVRTFQENWRQAPAQK